MQADDRNENGMQQYLVVHRTTTVTEGGAPELRQRLAEVYGGPGTVFPLPADPPPGYTVRITVDRIGGRPWTS